MRRIAFALTALALSLSTPSVTRAQPCCSATTGGEIGFVGPCRRALVALQTSWEHAFGTFDHRGDYRSLAGMRADDVVSTLTGGFRFLDGKLQLNGALPLRVQRRDFDDASPATRAGMGDASAAFYWSAIEGAMSGIERGDPSSYLPFLDVFVGSKAPTGRSPDEAQHASAADATGNGSWELFAGLKLTQFLTHHHALTATFTWDHRFARTVGGYDFAPGERYTARLAWLHIPNLFWNWGIFTAMTFTGPVHRDGAEVPSSRTRRTQIGVFASRVLVLPHWELTGSVTTDALFDGGGRNLPFAGTTATLAVQWSYL